MKDIGNLSLRTKEIRYLTDNKLSNKSFILYYWWNKQIKTRLLE